MSELLAQREVEAAACVAQWVAMMEEIRQNTCNNVGGEGGTKTHWRALEARAERQAKARGDGQAGPSRGPNNDEN
jgi:hypothetical protein